VDIAVIDLNKVWQSRQIRADFEH